MTVFEALVDMSKFYVGLAKTVFSNLAHKFKLPMCKTPGCYKRTFRDGLCQLCFFAERIDSINKNLESLVLSKPSCANELLHSTRKVPTVAVEEKLFIPSMSPVADNSATLGGVCEDSRITPNVTAADAAAALRNVKGD